MDLNAIVVVSGFRGKEISNIVLLTFQFLLRHSMFFSQITVLCLKKLCCRIETELLFTWKGIYGIICCSKAFLHTIFLLFVIHLFSPITSIDQGKKRSTLKSSHQIFLCLFTRTVRIHMLCYLCLKERTGGKAFLSPGCLWAFLLSQVSFSYT